METSVMFWPRILGHKEDKLWVDDSGSISFQSPPKLSFLWQVCSSSLPYSAVEIKHITHFPRDTFPRRAHFVIMDSLRNRTGKQFHMKLGTLAVKGIDLHKFSFPNSSPVRLGSVCANILGRLLDDSWQDNRLPSTRERG